MNIQVAFYHGPASTWRGWFADQIIALGTWSQVTHCELVVEGVCHSSSGLDGGVRAKVIDLNDGKWELYEVPILDEQEMWEFIKKTNGMKYDFRGIIQFAIPFVQSREDEWFCSEWVAEAIGNPIRADKVTPKDLYKWAQKYGKRV